MDGVAATAAVTGPLAFTVRAGMELEPPNVPVFEFTAASVVAKAPAVVVISPVRAGKFAAGSVATIDGTPDPFVARMPLLAVARPLTAVPVEA